MGNQVPSELIISKAADIVIAYLATQTVEPDKLGRLVYQVRTALQSESLETFNDGSVLTEDAAGAMDMETVRPPSSPTQTSAVIQLQPMAEGPRPPVPIDQSVQRDYIVCMEDGKQYRSLRRHLMAKYQLTPDDYRRKWGLPHDYPMVAPSYAEERSAVAKRTGLGTKREAVQEAAPRKPMRRRHGSAKA